MAKKWRQLLENFERTQARKQEWEAENPPITRISLEEADAKRKIQSVGQEAVVCDLPCHGNHVPKEYSHTIGLVNVFSRGISVNNYVDPEEGEAAYYGTTCGLTEGKICVATDERLRRAVER